MPVTDTEKKISPEAEDRVSLPLYAGGLVVTLSGVLTVTAAVSQGSGTAVAGVALLLTLLGYAFSLACRHLKVQSRLIEAGCVAFLLYIVVRLAVHDPNLDWFLNGADRPDTKLAAGLMWLAVLRSWTLISDDLVLFSCVLSAAMIGLVGTQDVNTVTVVYFCLFVLAMVFLLIHQNYLQHRRLAASQERAHTIASLLPAQVGLTALCGFVVLALGAILIAPAQALFANVSLAQAIRGLVGSEHARDAEAPPGADRFSDDATLDIGKGSVWPTTSDVMLHVTPSDGEPHYWRGRTYDLYLGTGWQSTQDGNSLPVISAGETSEGTLYTIPTTALAGEGEVTRHSLPRRPLISSVEVRGDTDEFYYADEPRSLLMDSGGGELRPSADGRIDLDGRPVHAVYTVTSMPPPDTSLPVVQERLRRDGTNDPPLVRRLYLRSPLDPQNVVTTPVDLAAYRHIVAEALAGLPADRRSRFDKAIAIRDWVANHCTYSLDVQPIPDDTDHVRYFLMNSRRGYCDLFASSMVVLCRVAGIPARVATGFAPGDRDDTGFNLRAMDKHAWAEVYFPNDRWQVFDATVGTKTDGSVPISHGGGGFVSRVRAALLKGGLITEVLAVAILISLAYIVKTELYDRVRFRPRSRPAQADPAEQGYGLMTRTLARLGLPRYAWETPAEYERRAVPFLAAQEAALGVPFHAPLVSDVTARFTSARYGGVPRETDPALQRSLRDFAAAGVRARRVRFWRHFWRIKSPPALTGG